jgi:hypothetical protein
MWYLYKAKLVTQTNISIEMKRIFSTLLTMAIVAVSAISLQAQTPFYTQDFSGTALPTGWTTTDAGGHNAIWKHCAGPNANCANLYGHAVFASATAANGYMVMNSDGYGQLSSNHVSRLTSKAIDCSTAPKVFARFESLIGVYATDSDNNILLKVSTNGTTWTSFNFIPGLTSSNKFSSNPEISIVDISSIAAGHATVYLQFEWTGNYEYWWMLDDLTLSAVDPTPANDLAIGDFFYAPSSYATPASQIATDTFGFYALVSNKGTADQTNVTLYAQVRDFSNAVLFTDSVKIDVLPVGYVDSVLTLPNQYAPELSVGMYSIVYFVKSDGTDGKPADNVKGDFFQVTDNLYSKENGPTGGLRPGGGGDYTVGNLYKVSKDALDNYQALNLQVACATDSSVLPIQNVSVTAYIFRIHDDVGDDFSNFDNTTLFSASFDWVGVGSLTFPSDATQYGIQTVDLTDATTSAAGVAIHPGKRYVAAISYTDANNVAYQAFSDETKHFFISTLVFSTQWFGGGFGNDQNAVIRMQIALVSATDEHKLPEGTLSVFPNPVKDDLHLKVNFATPTDATITLAELDGRVIDIDNRKALSNDVLTYQIPQLPAGTYLARIATREGTQTKKFIVLK